MDGKEKTTAACPSCKGVGCRGCYGTGTMPGYERARIDALQTAYFAVLMSGGIVSSFYRERARMYCFKYVN